MKSGHELSPFWVLKSDGKASSKGTGRVEAPAVGVLLVAELEVREAGGVKVVFDSASVLVCFFSSLDVVLRSPSSEPVLLALLLEDASLDDSSSSALFLRNSSYSTAGMASLDRSFCEGTDVSRLMGT